MKLNTKQKMPSSLITYVSALLLALCWQSHVYAESEITKNAFNFTLKSHTSKNIKLSELRGNVILLGFWSTQCGKCIQQLGILNEHSKTYKDKGFTSLAINIDNMSKAFRIAHKNNLQFPVLFDDRDITRLYDIEAVPEYYLIDRDGKIRHSLSADKLVQHMKTQSLIRDLLNE